MGEGFLNSCKKQLTRVIVSAAVMESDNQFSAMSSALLNFYNHYCLDDHSSPWCEHDKVCAVEKTVCGILMMT